MEREPSNGAARLSAYPAGKVIVACEKCGRRVQYDKQAMLDAGGDRPLPHLLIEIIRRMGCDKIRSTNIYDRCGAKYENILPDGNAYQKAKGGR